MEKIIDLVKNTFNVSEAGAIIILGMIGIVILFIIFLIVYLLVKKNKKEEINEEPKEAIDNKPTEIIKEEKVEEIKPIEKEEKVIKKEKPKAEPKKGEIKEAVKKELSGKYEIFPVGKYFMYRLKASNGEILALSEIYKTSKGVNEAIDTVKNNIEVGTLSINEDKHSLWQFRLYSANKRLLVASAHYDTKDRCESAMESFKKFAFKSPVNVLAEDTEGFIEEVKVEDVEDKKGGKIVIEDYNPKGENEFKLIASNGEIMFTSIPYKTAEALLSTINTLKETIKEGSFFITKDKKGSYTFKLYSKLGRNVFYSEAYKTKQTVISALKSALSFVNLAEIELPEKLK